MTDNEKKQEYEFSRLVRSIAWKKRDRLRNQGKLRPQRISRVLPKVFRALETRKQIAQEKE